MSSRLLRSALAAALAFGTLGANFGYAPAVVSFAAGERVESLRLSNFSDEPLRLEIVPQRWDQTESGEVKLDASDDLAAMPSVLTIAPRHADFVRIALGVERGPRERSYRVLVSELPPFFSAQRGAGVSLSTRMAINVPVFISPSGPSRISGDLRDISLRGAVVEFSLVNTGDRHFKNDLVRVTVFGAGGVPIFTRRLEAWYVLAGERRRYRLDVPADVCRGARAIGISVDGGVRLDSTIALDRRTACV